MCLKKNIFEFFSRPEDRRFAMILAVGALDIFRSVSYTPQLRFRVIFWHNLKIVRILQALSEFFAFPVRILF